MIQLERVIEMLNQKEILQYAMKGIAVEIEELEKAIKQGYKYIEQIDKGEMVNTKKTKYEILDIITEKDKQMKQLEKEKFNIKWQIEVEMQDEN